MKRSVIISASAIAAIVIAVSVLYSVVNPGIANPANQNLQSVNNPIQKATMTSLDYFTNPTNVTSLSTDGYTWTPNVSYDSKSGTMYVAYEEKDGNTTNLYVKKSSDGGITFSSPVQVNDKPDVFLDGRVPPVIKVGPNGEVYILWVKGEPAPKLFMKYLRSLDFAVSTDGAKTFSPSTTIDQNEPLADRSFTALEVSPNGKIYVGWLQSAAKRLTNGTIVSDNSVNSTVRFSRSLDSGKTFEPSIAVGQNQCECCNVFLTSDGHNNVYISWRQKLEVPSNTPQPERQGMATMPGMPTTLVIRDIVVAHSSDGGQSFTKPVRVHADNFEWNTCLHVGAPMALDSKGVLHIAWYTGAEGFAGVHYTTSSDMGQTFSKPITLLTGDWVPPSRMALVEDGNDNTWVTWEDTTGLAANDVHWKYEDTKAKIEIAMITPDGKVIKRSDPLNQVDGKSPVITADNDMISVVWGSMDGGIQDSSIKLSS